VAGSCKHGNESEASVKGDEFLDLLSDCLLKRTLLYRVKLVSQSVQSGSFFRNAPCFTFPLSSLIQYPTVAVISHSV
jgi:hypothetical protein